MPHCLDHLPFEVYELLSAHRPTLQAVSRANYQALNRRDVEFTPAVVVADGRLSWRACVLAGRMGSPDWLSVAYDANDPGRILKLASGVLASTAPVSPVCVPGEHAPVVSAVVAALRRATSIRVKYMKPVLAPLALDGLKFVTIEWYWNPPPVPWLPAGLRELRLLGADVRGIVLPSALEVLDLHDIRMLNVPHLAAQIASAPMLKALLMSTDHKRPAQVEPPGADIQSIIHAAWTLDRLRIFGISIEGMLSDSESGRSTVASLAALVPRLDALMVANSGLKRLDGLSVDSLSTLDLAYTMIPSAELAARAWPMLRHVNVSGMDVRAIGAIATAAPELQTIVHNRRSRKFIETEAIFTFDLLAVAMHANLCRVDLSNSRLGRSVAATTMTIAQSPTIEWLALADCTDEPHIVVDPPTASPLRTLNLRYHGRVPVGLPDVLAALPDLESLDLSLMEPPLQTTWAAIEASGVRHLTVWGSPGAMPPLHERPVTIRFCYYAPPSDDL
jgi:hypothetical protein